MTSTGAFRILSLELAPPSAPHPGSPTSVTVQCLRCQHVTMVDIDAARYLPGGVALICASCGNRQAVATPALGRARSGF